MLEVSRKDSDYPSRSPPYAYNIVLNVSRIGGTAGCAVAGRLAEADPELSILLIEGGTDNYNDPTVIFPALFLTHLLPESKTTIFYQAIKSKHLADREVIIPAGGILGGGSSINLQKCRGCIRRRG